MNSKKLSQLVKDEFSTENAINLYIQKAEEGFFLGEKAMIENYFTYRTGKILDLGCGTGRTTIPLFEKGFDVLGIDFTPLMIEHAQSIATKKGLTIKYQIADACNLPFEDEHFDYALFSNQGHTQIPGKENRLQAMEEIYRVLKKDGIYIFSAHPRTSEFFWFWMKQRFRFYIMKPLGYAIDEIDFGDRFFERESTDTNSEKTFREKQYIHIPTIEEMKKLIIRSGFKILEINTQFQISETNKRKNPPVYYICKKMI